MPMLRVHAGYAAARHFSVSAIPRPRLGSGLATPEISWTATVPLPRIAPLARRPVDWRRSGLR